MARILALFVALSLVLALPAGAGARAEAGAPNASASAKKKKKPVRCRKGYVRKRVKVKVRGSKRKRTVVRCVKKRRRPAPRPTAPAPSATPPASSPPRPRRWSRAEWEATLSEARYAVAAPVTHYIDAPDGTQLSLTVHLPEGVAPGTRIPTLMQMTPYRPLDQAAGGYADFTYYVERGAAYVEADERGTGGSAGCLDFGGSADRADAVAFATWIRSQPWSNGRIVTDGVSHPGMGSVVAHAAIPGLTGALAHAPVVSYYQDEWYQGAKFEDQNNGPLYEAIEAAPPLPPEFADPDALKNQAATCRGETTLDFAPYDGPFGPSWADRDLSRHLPSDRKPILLTHGFIDLNVHPDHSQMYWDALPADYPKYAIFGWWYHGYPDFGVDEFADARHRWMDWLLFGTANGMEAEPHVLVQDSRLRWWEGEQWPLEASERVTLHTSGEALSPTPGASASATYPDSLNPVRGEWEGAHVAFRSGPLDADRLVNGAPVVDLVGSSSATSTKWVVYLMDEAPDGSWQRISHGYADSHSWKSEDTWTDLEPGRPYTWKVKLMPTAVVVAKGHRVTLVIASQDSSNNSVCLDDHKEGCYSPSGIYPALTAGRAENTVITGLGGTSVQLAWADPAKLRRAPYPASE